MFNTSENIKTRTMETLKKIIEDIEKNRIVITEDVFVSKPHAYSLGFSKDKEYEFYGVSFTRGKESKEIKEAKEKKAIECEPVVEVKKEAISNFIEPSTKPKISNSKCELFKTGGTYNCPCGKFSTKTMTGFKTHYNRCENK